MKFLNLFKKKVVWIPLSLATLWFGLHMAILLADGLTPEAGTADAIVVLGNKVERSGVPSLRLQDRLDKAVALFRAKRARCVIVSGGFGKEGFDEARVMKAYLLTKGLPEESVVQDSQGVNTRATAAFTHRFFKEQKYRKAIVVSQYYHILRCRLAFQQEGVPTVLGVAADLNVELRDPRCLCREFVAYYYYLLHSLR